MKKIAVAIIAIWTITLSLSMVLSAVQEPICIIPCEEPIYDASELPILCETKIDSTTQLLGVTTDGCYIVRHKGKVYICIPTHPKK